MDISVVVRGREDGSPPEAMIALAAMADELGYEELWIGEGPTWDAFVLATGVGLGTRRASLTVGPVPVSVRDPASISRGAASVASLVGRPVGVALGTASVRVVEKLHGRQRKALTDLREGAEFIRHLKETPPEQRHSGDPDAVFLRRLEPPDGPLTVAAFGEGAIRVAADHADRMLLDLVTPEQVGVLRTLLESEVDSRPRPNLAAWLPAAVEPTGEALRQLREAIAGYLTIGGYREMFVAAGFGEAVERARSGAGIAHLVEALPREAPEIVGLVGDRSDIRARLHAYSDAGLDEVALVPATEGDPSGQRTLSGLRSMF